jgi:hypothetical protein
MFKYGLIVIITEVFSQLRRCLRIFVDINGTFLTKFPSIPPDTFRDSDKMAEILFIRLGAIVSTEI